ncbi:uncharacterized protein VP01_1417g4 [Puccinia sorghi]|uniref:Uncharacterized protein n=1 Tax=Puccinia sorghi TaxID=27349 RepID=A0A0L6VLB2_9BASI|nr:uncharacterized protein VP01_1417g4 [Puccinia sorghi]
MVIESSPHSSIRRKMRGGSSGGINAVEAHSGNHRQSLAFELAAAMEPEENDQASILEQLGLGDDDDEGLVADCHNSDDQAVDQEGTIYEGEEYSNPNHFNVIDDQTALQFLEPELLRNQSSRSTIGSTNKRYSHASTFGSSISPRKSSAREASFSTPMRTLNRELSRSTLNTIDSTSHSNVGILDIDEFGDSIDLHQDSSQIDDHEEDGMYGSPRSSELSEDGDAEILEAGLKSTAKFLNLLKQSNTDCPTSLISNKALNSQQQSPTSPSTPTTPTATRTVAENQPDKQPIVEKMITDIVRTMTEQVRDRESQIRELKEIEIALSRTDRRFLADLDELPNILEERDFRNSTILGKSLALPSDLTSLARDGLPKPLDDLDQIVDRHDHELVQMDELGEDDEPEGGRLTPTGPRNDQHSSLQTDLVDDAGSKKKEGKRPIENLGELKLITNSLIHSLNQIHEHTQISRQTQIEIVRKLKGVKGLVANWRTDFDSIQNSIDFISNWELDQFRNPDDSLGSPPTDYRDKKIRGIFEVQVKLATSGVEKLLNDAFINASALLQPHPPPPSLIN